MTTVAVLQPGYLPWLGFFDQILRSDVFVFYDDVQFDKHGWRNRNRIKSRNGPLWLTVPVRSGGRGGQSILEVEIDNRMPWARKHLTAIAQNYARAPHLAEYFPQLEALLAQDWRRLVDVDIAVVALVCEWLGVTRTIARSSEIRIDGDKSTRLLNICRHFGADTYLSGDSAMSYLDIDLFADNSVRVEWQRYRHPVYRQLHGEFLSHLSVLDLIFNTGPESISILKGTL